MAWDRGLHPGELSHSSPLTNVEGSPTRITQIACFQRLAPPPARQGTLEHNTVYHCGLFT